MIAAYIEQIQARYPERVIGKAELIGIEHDDHEAFNAGIADYG
jgi:hypothetical protein